MDAVGRLREKAQNEATCIALNNECRLLRQQLAECKSKWEHFENSVAEKSMQCLSLENQLAECQRERDAYKAKAVIADIPMSDVEARLKEQLATVIRERDELVVALGRIASSRVVDIAQAALAKLGADKTGEK